MLLSTNVVSFKNFSSFSSKCSILCSKCERSPADPTTFELLCERDDCMVDPSLIQTLNEGDYSWSAGNYTDFWGRKLSDALLYKLGTLEPERGVRAMALCVKCCVMIMSIRPNIK